MLLLCRHRERVYCSPRSRTGIEIIQQFNALTLAVQPATGSRRAQNASRRTWDFPEPRGTTDFNAREFRLLSSKFPVVDYAASLVRLRVSLLAPASLAVPCDWRLGSCRNRPCSKVVADWHRLVAAKRPGLPMNSSPIFESG